MKKKVLLIMALAVLLSACSVYKTMMNLSRLQFKLESVSDFRLNGMNISDKSKLSDFGAMQIIQLTTSIAQNKLPVSFTVTVDAKNPNDGKGGFPATDITIKKFPWKLLINDKETISGVVSKPVKVPGVGQVQQIPIQVELNLLEFVQGNGVNDIVNLVLALGGKKSDPSKVKIVADPLLDTPIGEMRYPEPITIISKEFK